MQCPKCLSGKLQAMRLDDGLPAYRCQSCEGHWMPLLSYRDWVARNPFEANPSTDAPQWAVSEDARKALNCPKCLRIMTKYKIQANQDRRLDLCAHCDEVWLDAGEWDLLKQLQLDKSLAQVFTTVWQNKIKQQEQQQVVDQRFAELIGETDFERVRALKQWLVKHPKKAEMLSYLNLKGD